MQQSMKHLDDDVGEDSLEEEQAPVCGADTLLVTNVDVDLVALLDALDNDGLHRMSNARTGRGDSLPLGS